jgi:hypothetical protein
LYLPEKQQQHNPHHWKHGPNLFGIIHNHTPGRKARS